MKSINSAVLITVTILFISSCTENKAPENKIGLAELEEINATVSDKKEDQEFYSDTTGKQTGSGVSKEQKQPVEPSKTDWDKKIIKTASLNFEVKDYRGYYSYLREKVKSAGGYIAQEEQTQSDYKIENTLTVKVPVDQFDNAINLFTDNIEKLNEKKISSQDVTGEYVDTRSRMEAKKQVRQCYLGLLSQAKNMEEVLSVQSEINNIQEQIESGQGRMQYLNHSSVFSTVNITYYQVLNSAARDDSSPSFASKIGNAFIAGWSFTESLFIGLISVWPLYLVLAALIFLYRKFKTPKPKQA